MEINISASLIYGAIGLVSGAISAYGLSRYNAGKAAAEREQMRKDIELMGRDHHDKNAAIHDRISELQENIDGELKVLNNLAIEQIKQGSKLEGIILGKLGLGGG